MTDEQTNETDTEGKETPPTTEEKPKSTLLIDVANLAADRMEKANKETERLFKKQEERDARIALGGELGGRTEVVLVTEEEAKKKRAGEFFKGTALGGAISEL